MRVAYLINQYPKISHSFIRREIQALERLGLKIDRIAIRGWDGEDLDELDLAEQRLTRYVLKDGFKSPFCLVFPFLASQACAVVERRASGMEFEPTGRAAVAGASRLRGRGVPDRSMD